MNASLVRRGTVCPMISPVRVFSAAYAALRYARVLTCACRP
jgi:hypothetical protein